MIARTRIGRVHVKGGELHLLPQPADDPDDNRRTIIKHARMIADMASDDCSLSAFVVVGIFSDGTFSSGVRINKDNPFMGRTLLPSFVSEILRRDVITEPLVRGEI